MSDGLGIDVCIYPSWTFYMDGLPTQVAKFSVLCLKIAFHQRIMYPHFSH